MILLYWIETGCTAC